MIARRSGPSPRLHRSDQAALHRPGFRHRLVLELFERVRVERRGEAAKVGVRVSGKGSGSLVVELSPRGVEIAVAVRRGRLGVARGCGRRSWSPLRAVRKVVGGGLGRGGFEREKEEVEV